LTLTLQVLVLLFLTKDLPISPNTSPHLAISPRISPYLAIPRHTSPHLPTSPHISLQVLVLIFLKKLAIFKVRVRVSSPSSR